MPDMTPFIGGLFTAYEPDPAGKIALGYTDIRFYSASTEAGSYTLRGTVALASGTLDYSYNYTSAAATDWFYWAPYGATPGEGPASEAMPLGAPRSTRKLIRQAVGARLGLCDVYTMLSVSSSTVGIISDLIDPDASPHAIANRFIRCVGGTGTGQTRRIRAGTTGYAVATGTLTVNRAFSPAWVANDEVELWSPRGGRDTSAIVDAAMQDARTRIWWEDVHYWSAESDTTEYALPDVVREDRVYSVEYAAGTYPNAPSWQPVGWYRIGVDGGSPVISLGRTFSSTTVLRLSYARPGDRMDSDSDYWEAPSLDWIVSEVAFATIARLAIPRGGQEDVNDALRSLGPTQADVEAQRRVWMPRAAARVRVAR